MSWIWVKAVLLRLSDQVQGLGKTLQRFAENNPLGLLLILVIGSLLTFLYYRTYLAANLGFDKKLWEWLDLLIIPVALAVVVWYFERRERSADRSAADIRMRHEQKITDERNDVDRRIAKDQINQQALESCLEYVSGQLIDFNKDSQIMLLRTPIIRARVLEVLVWLSDDIERRDQLLRFLRETGLLTGTLSGDSRPSPILLFQEAILTKLRLAGAKLNGCRFEFSDLSNVNFEDADLSDTRLDGAALANAVLTGAKLCKATLQEATLNNANLEGVDLTGAKLIGASLQNANLVGARTDEELLESETHECDLTRADLTGADLSDARLANADLSLAILQRTTITEETLSPKWRLVHELVNNDYAGRDLRDVDLSRAKLNGICLNAALLNGADFRGADLSRSALMDTDLRGTQLQGSILAETDFSRADFSGVDLRGVNLENATLDHAKLMGTQVDDPPMLAQKWRIVWAILNPPKFDTGESLSLAEGEASELIDLLSTTRDLRMQDLTGQDLSRANLTGASLKGFILKNVNLSESIIEGADFQDAVMEGADLSNCVCHGAKLSPEQLSSAINVPPEFLAAVV